MRLTKPTLISRYTKAWKPDAAPCNDPLRPNDQSNKRVTSPKHRRLAHDPPVTQAASRTQRVQNMILISERELRVIDV